MQEVCAVSLNFKSRGGNTAKLWSVSIADFLLLTALETSKLLITAGADGEAVREATEKAQKRVYFLLCFFSLAACAAPLRDNVRFVILDFYE